MRFFKELRDHLDYHFYRSEWETYEKLGLSNNFLVRGIWTEDICHSANQKTTEQIFLQISISYQLEW